MEILFFCLKLLAKGIITIFLLLLGYSGLKFQEIVEQLNSPSLVRWIIISLLYVAFYIGFLELYSWVDTWGNAISGR